MKKIDGGMIAVTILCVFLGTMIGFQFKTVKSQSLISENQRVSELSTQLTATVSENENLKTLLDESQRKINEYEQYIVNDSDDFKAVLDEIDRLKMFAGVTTLTGRGITVTINDSQKAGQGQDGVASDAFLIHAEDILSILNELNVAGAEAISINGERLVASSAIRCSGSVINVNDVKIAAPFVISAIGDTDVLEAALNFPGGVADTLRPWGIELSIRKLDKVSIPPYKKSLIFNEAISVETEGN